MWPQGCWGKRLPHQHPLGATDILKLVFQENQLQAAPSDFLTLRPVSHFASQLLPLPRGGQTPCQLSLSCGRPSCQTRPPRLLSLGPNQHGRDLGMLVHDRLAMSQQ